MPFDRAKALRWREVLCRPSCARRSCGGGFDAIERIADNWVGWDYPVARYSEEAAGLDRGRAAGQLPAAAARATPPTARSRCGMWAPLAPFLQRSTPGAVHRAAQRADRPSNATAIFRTEVAPGIAEQLVQGLRLAFVGPDGGESEVPLDATLVSRYAETTPLYVTLNQAGAVPGRAARRHRAREDLVRRAAAAAGRAGDRPLRDGCATVRRTSPRCCSTRTRILDDISLGDAVVVATPLSPARAAQPAAGGHRARRRARRAPQRPGGVLPPGDLGARSTRSAGSCSSTPSRCPATAAAASRACAATSSSASSATASCSRRRRACGSTRP